MTVGSLQHILEGYKVADAMAKHGATGSTFSDWWAYKFEVIDAIPYNGALMHRAGIIVSFNSDDDELARHLNHEAAKAGQVRRTEARRGNPIRYAQPGQAIAHRSVCRFDHGRQASGPGHLEQFATIDIESLRTNLDRWPQVLRPRS